MDVQTLFTNVPVQDTINIICKNAYSHPTVLPPPINEATLRKLLIACTTECPFTQIDGKIYMQKIV